ncbi:M15 family metallopeptidase [Clavibacter sp. Sh2141]|uniref:M15 family metallopeptidase n=1 Tax=unclassified Clavibacter TaxID=2626594 RepID=UPI0039BCFB37
MNRTPASRLPRRRPAAALLAAVLLVPVLAGCVATDPAGAALDGSASGASRYDASDADPTGDPRTPDDGWIPLEAPISPFDDEHPGIARLDPALRAAMQDAARDAAAQGVDMVVASGWRSARYQRSLLEDGVAKYGSAAEARKWVSTPERSAHVTGDAVDIGPTDADSWLQQHGDRYGLCQTYANEMWHFELGTEPGGTCPAGLQDAAG